MDKLLEVLKDRADQAEVYREQVFVETIRLS